VGIDPISVKGPASSRRAPESIDREASERSQPFDPAPR
jgi:hypothetical protein